MPHMWEGVYVYLLLCCENEYVPLIPNSMYVFIILYCTVCMYDSTR